jgi:hypothetical protein
VAFRSEFVCLTLFVCLFVFAWVGAVGGGSWGNQRYHVAAHHPPIQPPPACCWDWFAFIFFVFVFLSCLGRGMPYHGITSRRSWRTDLTPTQPAPACCCSRWNWSPYAAPTPPAQPKENKRKAKYHRYFADPQTNPSTCMLLDGTGLCGLFVCLCVLF